MDGDMNTLHTTVVHLFTMYNKNLKYRCTTIIINITFKRNSIRLKRIHLILLGSF